MEYYHGLAIAVICLLAVVIIYNITLALLLRGDRLRAAEEAQLLQEQAVDDSPV